MSARPPVLPGDMRGVCSGSCLRQVLLLLLPPWGHPSRKGTWPHAPHWGDHPPSGHLEGPGGAEAVAVPPVKGAQAAVDVAARTCK